jgi:lipopolysaccharide transport system ATP-binding protein
MFDYGERMCIRITCETSKPVEAPHLVCAITRSDETMCCNFSSLADGASIGRLEGKSVIEILTPPLSLVSDQYRVDVLVRQRTGEVVAAQSGAAFHVRHEMFDAANFGVFHERAQWLHGSVSGASPSSDASRAMMLEEDAT